MKFDWQKHLDEALSNLSSKLQISLTNKLLFYEALTHKSLLYFHPDYPYGYNERLEFLGDAILEFVVSQYLFKKYHNFKEGQLTLLRASLINREKLLEIAEKLELEKLILRAPNIDEKGLKKVLSDAVEALIGAFYLSLGFEFVEKFIKEYLLENVDEIVEKGLYKDPKSLLQEIFQDKFKILPKYTVLKEEGPSHQKKFVVGLFLEDKLISVGEGSNKQEAELQAAAKALKKIK